MSNPCQELSQKIQTNALKHIAEQNKLKKIKLAGWVCDRVPSNGSIIYQVSANEADKPNGPLFSIVIDENGEVVNLKVLSKKEKVEFFPSFPRPDTKGFFLPDEIIHFPIPFPLHPHVTINPDVNNFTIEPGEVITEAIHVTIPAVPNPLIDIYFLADATGSMGDVINNVKTGAAQVITDIQTACPGISFAFGVGSYYDFCSTDPSCFNHLQSITTNTIQANASITGITLGNGGDDAEGQFFALQQIATIPNIGWRLGSQKIVVWFGDNPGHDPICASLTGLSADINESDVIAALNGIGIRVLAISTNTGFGLNGDAGPISGSYPCPDTGNPDQGTRIAAATVGQYSSSVNASAICTTITNMVIAATNIYNNINLVATGSSASLISLITPIGGYGPVDGSGHDYEFQVTFTGPPCNQTDQVFTGTIDVVADGHVIAQKKVKITVLACAKWSYGVKFLCGYVKELAPGVVPLTPGSTLRPGIYATEVNILNYHNYPITVHKYLYPLIRKTEPIGREPHYVHRRGEDAITLPKQSSTFDDCYRLHEIIGDLPIIDEPLSVGFLEIVSPVELNVTAVYTTNDLRGISVGLEVIQVEGKLIGK